MSITPLLRLGHNTAEKKREREKRGKKIPRRVVNMMVEEESVAAVRTKPQVIMTFEVRTIVIKASV